jgi:glycosyltransferase involved in cell wall biosynthesis
MIERTPSAPPKIDPLPPGSDRPRWSVMIPAYNCSAYLKDTIKSVLANNIDEQHMQIEVIDDYSTDTDVEKLVREAGGGRVGVYRQEKNVGSLRNFESCINRARGEWIHILHGDDMVGVGFYDEIERLFNSHPEAGAAFTGIAYMDEKGEILQVNDTTPKNEGVLEDWLSQIATHNLIQPPAIVVKRKVYETIGSFFAVHYGEDWEMWVRIAANFPVSYSPKRLAMYRYLRKSSISSSSLRSGQTSKDILKVIDIIQDYLPASERKRLKKEAKKHYSCYFAGSAKLIYEEYDDRTAAVKQAKLALKMNVNWHTVMSILKLYIKFGMAFLGLKSIASRSGC